MAGLTNDDKCKDTEVSSHVKIKVINPTIILNGLSSTINYSKRKEMRSSGFFFENCVKENVMFNNLSCRSMEQFVESIMVLSKT